MTTDLDFSGVVSLPARPRAGHKGTFGTVAIIGGSSHAPPTMVGAPALCATAALRAGCGLCRVIAPHPILPAILTICPSATGVALPVDLSGALDRGHATQIMERALVGCDAVAIGPGLGVSDESAQLVVRIIQRDDTATVIDADALNAMAQIPDLFRDFRAPSVLTPHPGEFARLAAAFKVGFSPTDPDERPQAAAALARRLGCIVVLKGAGTCVSDGHRTWVCDHGHPCLATAGTGDVLTGLLASLLAQHIAGGGSHSGLYEIARVAVEAHARAGEAWAQREQASAGLLASELCDLLPSVLEPMRAHG